MSDRARELVERMVAAGEWPDPRIFEGILAEGEDAVEPLLEVVRRDAHGWPEEAPVVHALGLLRMMPSPRASPVLLDVFRRYDNETLEGLPPVLRPFGTAVVEPLMEILRTPGWPWYSFSVACQVALNNTADAPELRARVQALLRQRLADLVARAESLTANEVSTASSLVVDLSHLADPEARELIDAALQAELSEMMGEEDVERSYREHHGWVEQREKPWLDQYREDFSRHLEYERVRAEKAVKPPPRPAPLAYTPLPRLPTPPGQRPQGTIGRNDPCWCGSGKKYKKCHMRADQK